MCYNVEYLYNRLVKWAVRYEGILPEEASERYKKYFNLELDKYYFVSGYQHPQLPIVLPDGLSINHWGLIPFWVKDKIQAFKIRKFTLNAACETIFEKPSYRSIIKKNRCLIGVNGFYEWRKYNGKKYPYLIKSKTHEMFSLGGVYDTWIDKSSGEIWDTFSIITTPANPLLEKVHNTDKRMPLIIPYSDEANWINPQLSKNEIRAMFKPYEGDDLHAHTVSNKVNNVREHRNVPDIILNVEYPELPPV